MIDLAGTLPAGDLDLTKDVGLRGYNHKSESLTAQNGCRVKGGDVSGTILHVCDTEPGYSGAPILQGGSVVGVHLGYARKLGQNLAQLTTQTNASNIGELRKRYDFAAEVDCHTDCFDNCKRRVVGRWVSNPVCEVSCQAERVIACNPPSQEVKVCGVGFGVSMAVLGACQLSMASIPVACTGAAAASAGSSCAVSVGLAAGVCQVTVGVISGAAAACIGASVGKSPSEIKLEW